MQVNYNTERYCIVGYSVPVLYGSSEVIFGNSENRLLTKADIARASTVKIGRHHQSHFATIRSLHKQAGLTLLEMLIAIAIVIIVLTVVAPNMQTMVAKNRTISEINELSGVIQYARFTAIDQNATAVVCPAPDFENCSTNWNQAKIVFIDSNGNNSRDSTEPLLMTSTEITSGNNVTGPSSSIVFAGSGAINIPTNIKICPKNNEATIARGLSINAQGRVKVNVDSDGNSIVEDSEGNDISCS